MGAREEVGQSGRAVRVDRAASLGWPARFGGVGVKAWTGKLALERGQRRMG